MRIFASAIGLVCLCLSPALAAPGKTDADWPCHQPKVGDYPLASVWDGPPVAADPAVRAAL